jgi:hypothetical protein
LVDDVLELIAQVDGKDGRRRLVGAQPVIVAGEGHRGPDGVGVGVYGPEGGRDHEKELGVLVGGVAGREPVAPVGPDDGPVVVLARAVHPGEGLLVQEAHQPVIPGRVLEGVHGEKVVIHRNILLLEDRGYLELGRAHLVVAGLPGDAQPPEAGIDVRHEFQDPGFYPAEIMVFHLLMPGRAAAEQGAPAHDDVRPPIVKGLVDQEIFLLGAEGGVGAVGFGNGEYFPHPPELLDQGGLGAEKRGLEIERLAVVAAEHAGNAEHRPGSVRVGHEGVAGGIPGGVAPGLESRPDAPGGEGGGVGLALDQVLAGELLNHPALEVGENEGLVLFRRAPGEGLEPVGEMGRPLPQSPGLHAVGDLVGYVRVQGGAVENGPLDGGENPVGQVFLHGLEVKAIAPEGFADPGGGGIATAAASFPAHIHLHTTAKTKKAATNLMFIDHRPY